MGRIRFMGSHPAGVSCPGNTSQPLVLAGTGDVLQYVDYSQSIASLRGNAIGVGFWGDADDTVIRYSKIHDVGQCLAYDHLIYLSHGNNVQIYGNWLYDDPHGDAVQLYPAPTNARIYDNVVDQVGEGFVVGNTSPQHRQRQPDLRQRHLEHHRTGRLRAGRARPSTTSGTAPPAPTTPSMTTSSTTTPAGWDASPPSKPRQHHHQPPVRQPHHPQLPDTRHQPRRRPEPLERGAQLALSRASRPMTRSMTCSQRRSRWTRS